MYIHNKKKPSKTISDSSVSTPAMAPAHKLKITEQSKVSPFPPPSLQQSLSSTFFDVVFLPFPPVQRILFYDYPRPKSHFFDYELPTLKQSLSLALHKFYPLAGNLIKGQNPEIICSGNDFVHFTVTVSDANFNELSGNHAREIGNLTCLVPELVSSKEKTTVFAVQVTVFPSTGVCIGTTVHHAVADGSTYKNFMKMWSSADPTSPSYDRFLISDPKNLKSIFLKDLQSLQDDDRTLDPWDLSSYPDTMITTFVFTKDMLSKLGSKTSMQCSPYSLACGYIWSCLTKTRDDMSKKIAHFGFVTGCRPRHDPPLPPSYFGNCLGICCVEARRRDLIAENGEVAAAEAIWKVIKGLEEGVFDNAEDWVRNVHDYANKRALTVAGSPKMGIYEIDFGWGRPKKVEIISIEKTGALSLAESRAEKGGIEVGLVLPKHEMEKFISIFVDGMIDA